MEREKDARPLPSLPSTGFPAASSGSGQTGKGVGTRGRDDGAAARVALGREGRGGLSSCYAIITGCLPRWRCAVELAGKALFLGKAIACGSNGSGYGGWPRTADASAFPADLHGGGGWRRIILNFNFSEIFFFLYFDVHKIDSINRISIILKKGIFRVLQGPSC